MNISTQEFIERLMRDKKMRLAKVKDKIAELEREKQHLEEYIKLAPTILNEMQNDTNSNQGVSNE